MPWLILLSLFTASSAGQAYELRLSAASVDREDWIASDVRMDIDLARDTIDLRVAHLEHRDSGEAAEAISVSCRDVTFDGRRYSCPAGELSLTHPMFSTEQARLELHGDLAAGTHEIRISELGLFDGVAEAVLSLHGSAWNARGQVAALSLETFRGWLASYADDLASLRSAGRADLTVDLTGGDSPQVAGKVELTTTGFAVDNADGSLGIASMHGTASISWQEHPQETILDGSATIHSGELYIDPVYLQATKERPISLSSRAILSSGDIDLSTFELGQSGLGELRGAASLSRVDGQVRQARLTLTGGELDTLYPAFVENQLDPQGLLGLSATGSVEGEVDIADGRPVAVTLSVRDGAVSDGLERISVVGLWGNVAWSANGSERAGEIGWKDAAVYGIPLEDVTFRGDVLPSGFRLHGPAKIAVLGGELVIESMEMSSADRVRARVDSRISGMDLSRLSSVLGWPAMSGELTAMAPSVVLADDVLTVQGAVLIRAFSGTVTASGIRLDRPLGPAPMLHGEVMLRGLDLHELTRTFSFGNIQGRLDGDIRGLELLNWAPVRFDAFLGTPEGYEGRRRISQNAVEELASVGGGATARLSQGMLGLFDEFPYRRLGIGCKLQGGVCTMRGVAPAKRGYYLVEGQGLPRIDVVGFAEQVDWEVLVARLVAASRGGPPVME